MRFVGLWSAPDQGKALTARSQVARCCLGRSALDPVGRADPRETAIPAANLHNSDPSHENRAAAALAEWTEEQLH
jgi:hypothetical protein